MKDISGIALALAYLLATAVAHVTQFNSDSGVIVQLRFSADPTLTLAESSNHDDVLGASLVTDPVLLIEVFVVNQTVANEYTIAFETDSITVGTLGRALALINDGFEAFWPLADNTHITGLKSQACDLDVDTNCDAFGFTLEMLAERIATYSDILKDDGTIHLEGHVRVQKTGDTTDEVVAWHVDIPTFGKLKDQATGVIVITYRIPCDSGRPWWRPRACESRSSRAWAIAGGVTIGVLFIVAIVVCIYTSDRAIYDNRKYGLVPPTESGATTAAATTTAAPSAAATDA